MFTETSGSVWSSDKITWSPLFSLYSSKGIVGSLCAGAGATVCAETLAAPNPKLKIANHKSIRTLDRVFLGNILVPRKFILKSYRTNAARALHSPVCDDSGPRQAQFYAPP